MSGDIPADAGRRYSLPPAPAGSVVRFCESVDNGERSATLKLAAPPSVSEKYLKRIEIPIDTFSEVSEDSVRELSVSREKAWAIKRGGSYGWGTGSAEWNGDCLPDYTAYIRTDGAWNGEIMLSVECTE
ncbi:hypothetical protein ACFVT1_00200 [Streptomyces sp. NPDC057963]|uniref:hypothetical protein n=1 Tax=Streptomyces sp. NPDC057963 TaxID=3346290 RepID=UPI0036EB9859